MVRLIGGANWWRMLWLLRFAATLFLQVNCLSAYVPKYSFLHRASTAPPKSYYDYIVIGGGTAGCPLAATLSKNADVLVLERGGSPYGNPNITLLSSFGAALSDLSPTSPSQRFISEDGVINARARVLGGGSCLNAGFYSRAGSRYVREAGWDPRLVKESYQWVEDVVAFQPQMGGWQSAVRDGLVEAGVVPNNGFTYDHILGTKVGGTLFDKQGNRHTAADLLKYANPSRIRVLLHATVHRILFRRKGLKRPRAHGVVFRDERGNKHIAYLKPGSKNEVILSSGALGSPQLLMLSGVGPAAQLKAHNIKVVLEQPMVGQGMSDNPMNAVFIPSPVPVEVALIQVVGITPFGSYIEAACGENFAAGAPNKADLGISKIGQLSTSSPKQTTPKVEANLRTPDSIINADSRVFQGGFLLTKVTGPLSTGHLELKTRNPSDNPSVTFNYFSNPKDLARCVKGIETIGKVINSQAFSKYKFPQMTFQILLNLTAQAPVNLLPHHANVSTSFEQFCKDTTMTIWHYHGGCQMGRVVDSDYKVMGIDALRVVDGSTFLASPGTNPQATVMMLGRYMGVKILRERLAHRKSH